MLSAVASGASATVYLAGRNTALTALTVGTRYYLSATTPGAATATPVTGAGNKNQFLGTAVSASQIDFVRRDPVTLAS